jgi:tetratricopeptide (TPR) repeat protein
MGKCRRFDVDTLLTELHSLKSARAQECLTEMIGKTADQMEAAEGPEARASLRRLNTCRGGFTYEAAEAISGAGAALMDHLDTLQRYQFLRFDGVRYRSNPLVLEALGEDPHAHDAHRTFYEDLAWAHDQRQDYLGLDPESANLEAAFERLLTAGEAAAALGVANACRDFLANRGRFEQNLAWFERLAVVIGPADDERTYANLQNSLGLAYQEHPLGDRRANLGRAITAYEAALVYSTPETAPLDYAMTQNNLGNAYTALAALEDRAANLGRAISAYQAALLHYTPEAAPLAYAGTQNNLGNAYNDLAALEDRAGNLGRAISAYTAALVYIHPGGRAAGLRRKPEQPGGCLSRSGSAGRPGGQPGAGHPGLPGGAGLPHPGSRPAGLRRKPEQPGGCLPQFV